MRKDEILENIENDVYTSKLKYPSKPEGYNEEGYIYNLDETVRWNREHRTKLMAEYAGQIVMYNEEKSRCENKFKTDLINAIIYENIFTEKQAELIYEKAWDEGHAYGLLEVTNTAFELSDLVYACIEASKY